MIKITRSWGRLIFIMEVPLLVRLYLYIETPWTPWTVKHLWCIFLPYMSNTLTKCSFLILALSFLSKWELYIIYICIIDYSVPSTYFPAAICLCINVCVDSCAGYNAEILLHGAWLLENAHEIPTRSHYFKKFVCFIERRWQLWVSTLSLNTDS